MSLTFTDKISSVMLNFTNICCLKKTAIVLTASRKFWQKCIYQIKTKLMNSELIKPDETVKIKKQWFDPYIMTKLLSKWYTCIYGKKSKPWLSYLVATKYNDWDEKSSEKCLPPNLWPIQPKF